MGVTLKQAFTLWANAPRNMVLAAKSREAVQKVLMKKWSDIDLEQITPAFAERIFRQSSESKEIKIKAASILVYLLQWGGDHGHCQRPTFDYTIANAKAGDTAEPEAETEQTNDEPKNETIMEQKKKPRGKQPKPVAQIDPKTLNVVKVWPSRCEAERQLGACNIDRAVARKRMSAGFYWCAPEDADTFKPGDITRREPSSCVSAATDALAVFTDEELLEELDRRGWDGELSRRQVVTIGAK